MNTTTADGPAPNPHHRSNQTIGVPSHMKYSQVIATPATRTVYETRKRKFTRAIRASNSKKVRAELATYYALDRLEEMQKSIEIDLTQMESNLSKVKSELKPLNIKSLNSVITRESELMTNLLKRAEHLLKITDNFQ